MKITLLCISDSDKHFSSAIAEYEKRMGKDLKIINLKPVKHGNREQIIQKETAQVIQRLENKRFQNSSKILLSKGGKQVTTEIFLATLWPWVPVTFLIWWPYGLDETQIAPLVDHQIAFGKQTMPHGLVKLVLLEQVYRASMLQQNRSYHY